LRAPAQDAKGLASVLESHDIGNFQVRTLLDEPAYKIKQEIEDFFSEDCSKDDFLLLYFSCHGIKSQDGQLYYATSDTRKKRLKSTSVEASFVNSLMSGCRAWRQILLLDCCYSGAFAKNFTIKADKDIHTNEHFDVEGRGKLVMTASDSMQYSFEGDDTIHTESNEPINSVFTSAVIQGLKTGEADLDHDGKITYEELYEYISNQVRLKAPNQTPRKWGFDTQGEIVIAKNPNLSITKLTSKEQKEELEDGGEKYSTKHLLKLLQEGKIEEFNSIRKNEEDTLRLRFLKADLSEKNLMGVDLHDVDLTGAKLVNTKLGMANLNEAILKGADLVGADLRSADLYRADLSEANLTGADLRGANLKGMIEFTGANLTSADLRGADLNGMISFDGAILYDVDFTGAKIDTTRVNFKGAKINKNVAGLPKDFLVIDNNKYVNDIKAFSEAIEKQFKSLSVEAEQVKSIEESVKELTHEVEDINIDEERLTDVKKQSIKTKLITVLEKVIDALPKTNEKTIDVSSLKSFEELIGELQPIIEIIVVQREKEDRKALPTTGQVNQYAESLKSFYEYIKQQFKARNIPTGQLKPIEQSIQELCKDVEDVQEPEKITWIKKKRIDTKFADVVKNVTTALPEAQESLAVFTALAPLSNLIEEGGEIQEIVKDIQTNINTTDHMTPDDAEESVKTALTIQSNDTYALTNKGIALHNLEKYNEAVQSYDKALEIDPKYASAWNNKGLALNKLGKYNEAIDCYDKALEIDPKYASAWNNKGLALNKLGKYNAAIECYEQAIKIDPNHADAWNNKGWTLFPPRLGKYNAAIECYDKAIKINPNHADAWYNKGLALDSIEKYNEAIECYDKAIKINPNHADALYNKARANKMSISGMKGSGMKKGRLGFLSRRKI
jgi:tetratricopeptide (TPR) repeat protein